MVPDYRLIQTEASECGLSCLAMVSSMLGTRVELATLRAMYPTSAHGMTMKTIMDGASVIGLAVRPVRCDVADLKTLKGPLILHWGLDHFVVLQRMSSTGAKIFDPAVGWRRVSLEEMGRKFTGVAAEITRVSQFQRQRETSPLKIFSLIQWTPQVRASLWQAVLLSVMMLAYVLASPFFIQVTIDDAVLKGDLDLMVVLALGFGAFAIFNAVAEGLRGVALQKVTSLLNWNMTQRFFHHLIRLPLPWFQRRRLADVLMRFQALDPVRNLISNGWISGLIDGVLAAVTGAMLCLYSPSLALIAGAAFALYLALRCLAVPVGIRFAAQALTASITEQGKRIETLRSIQTIKAMGAESERETDWSDKMAESIRRGQNSALVNMAFSNAHKLINALAMILSTYFGAKSIVDGHMTVGVFYAAIAYQTQFLTRSYNFIEQIVAWRMLELYTFRLADVVLTQPETGIDRPAQSHLAIKGKLAFDRVFFSYSPQDRMVLKNVSFKIEPGEFIALVGPSGSGKSTILKLMSSLYSPALGEITLDDTPLSSWGPRTVRRAMGVILQDDELLSGSICDNVTFFETQIDVERVWECLRLAAIDDEIRQIPMQIQTQIGDLGANLSGGQKQRILLARALYRQPSILLLDEATSHVDTDRERKINETLKALQITRVVAAHRPETIAAADRIIEIQPGGTIAVRNTGRRNSAKTISKKESSEAAWETGVI